MKTKPVGHNEFVTDGENRRQKNQVFFVEEIFSSDGFYYNNSRAVADMDGYNDEARLEADDDCGSVE